MRACTEDEVCNSTTGECELACMIPCEDPLVCNRETRACEEEFACTGDEDCDGDICDTDFGICVECVDDADCFDAICSFGECRDIPTCCTDDPERCEILGDIGVFSLPTFNAGPVDAGGVMAPPFNRLQVTPGERAESWWVVRRRSPPLMGYDLTIFDDGTSRMTELASELPGACVQDRITDAVVERVDGELRVATVRGSDRQLLHGTPAGCLMETLTGRPEGMAQGLFDGTLRAAVLTTSGMPIPTWDVEVSPRTDSGSLDAALGMDRAIGIDAADELFVLTLENRDDGISYEARAARGEAILRRIGNSPARVARIIDGWRVAFAEGGMLRIHEIAQLPEAIEVIRETETDAFGSGAVDIIGIEEFGRNLTLAGAADGAFVTLVYTDGDFFYDATPRSSMSIDDIDEVRMSSQPIAGGVQVAMAVRKNNTTELLRWNLCEAN